MGTAISTAESSGLPAGLRLRRHRKLPIWLFVVALVGAGLVLGAILSGAPSTAILGTLAVLIALGAAIYWPALGLAILAFTYPFDLTTYAGPIKVTSSDALIAVLLAVLVVRQVFGNRPAIRRTKLDLPIILFAIASVASLLGLTGNYSGQLVALIKAFGGFVLFFIATQCVRELKDALLVIGSVFTAGVLQAVQTIIPFATGSEGVSLDNRATGTLIDPNLFAGYLVLLIPLVIAIGVSFRKWWPVVPAVGATLALVAALAITLSRSGWLGLIAGAIVLLLLLGERRWRIAGVAAAVAICFVVVGLSGPIAARLGPAPDTGPMQMLTDRSQVWNAAIRIALDHPIFGVGIDNFQNFYPVYSGRDDELNHAHNLFLNMAAERGAIGLVAFGVVLLFLFKALAGAFSKAGTTIERALVVGLLASFVAYFAHSMFDVSYYDYKVLLLFWLLAGLSARLPPLVGSQRQIPATAASLT